MENDISLTIDGETVHLSVGGKIFTFPLGWIIFGSKKSTDCDMILWVPREFVEMKMRTHIYNNICLILDKIMGKILNTEKEINSSLGYWDNGELLWAQKGSNTSEVNNGIISTFGNHRQMYHTCPITVLQKRDVWDKILTTVRDMLCKMNKTMFFENDKESTFSLLLSVLSIPQIKEKGRNFIHSLLRGFFISQDLFERVKPFLPSEISSSLESIVSTNENKRRRLNILNRIYDSLGSPEKLENLLETLLEENKKDSRIVDEAANFLSEELINELKDEFLEETSTGLIKLNRIIRQVRRIQELGVRLDLLGFLDWRKIIYVMEPKDVADRYKDIAFKLCQCMALMRNAELFDKEELCNAYPSMTPFLMRKGISEIDLINITQTIKAFTEEIVSYEGYSRNRVEIMRHNV